MSNFNYEEAFAKVVEMQAAYGQTNRIESFTRENINHAEVAKLARLKYNLISEEFKETREAAQTKGFGEEFVDGIVDQLVVGLGAVSSFGCKYITDQRADMFPGIEPKWKENYEEILDLLVIVMESNLQQMERAVHLVEDPRSFLSEAAATLYENAYIEYVTAMTSYVCLILLYAESCNPAFNIQKNFDGVMEANMAKFARDEQHAIESVESLAEQGFDAYYEPVENSTLYRLRRKSDGKMLKSKGWTAYEIQLG